MGELRRDYFEDRYVIISPERAKRPHDFQTHPMEPTKATPFTPGNEALLPAIIYEEPQGKQWRVRVVPNKYAIVRPDGERELHTQALYSQANNYGYHELLIEGQQDGVPFASLGAERISESLRIAFERVKHLQQRDDVQYVALFKNERPEAGASINHPHSQIVATGIMPSDMQRRLALHRRLRAEFGFSPLYKILDYERGSRRMIADSKHFALLCPYASAYAFEVLFVPLRDANTYTSLSDEERDDLSHHLVRVLGKLASFDAPYNMLWFHSPEQGMHWHLSITPRLNVWAGLEMCTGIIVNPTPPEEAAAYYRS